jgi:hypothetical protein
MEIQFVLSVVVVQSLYVAEENSIFALNVTVKLSVL